MEKTRHCSSPVQYSPNSEAWWWQHHAVGVFFSCRDRTTGCNRGKDECGQVQGYPGQKLEIDRYIGLPIFFPIFKHFTIIGFVKKKYRFFFFFYYTYIIIQSITSSEILFSAFDPSKYTHLEQCSLRRSSSTTTACNFIQDSLVWNTLNYINIYYRTIISPINI